MYEIEVGEDKHASKCHCCGSDSYNSHGFVYKHHDAYAVYYAAWSPSHTEAKVSFAIGIGEWGDESDSRDRTSFGVEVQSNKDDYLLKVIGRDDSPWGETDLLGTMLTREQALAHPHINDVYSIIKQIVQSHSALNSYLSEWPNLDG